MAVAFKILLALFVAMVAQRQGRNPYLWFGLGLLFGLIGFFPLFFIPPKKGSSRRKKGTVRQPAPAPRPKQIDEVPAPKIVGPIHKHWYYLDASQKQQGPMSFQAFSKALREGKISPSSYVWHEELSDWKLLKDLQT